MSLELQLRIEGDEPALKFLAELGDAPESGELWEVIGRAEMILIKDHLIEKDGKEPNKLGGARTHYYLGAGESTDVVTKPGQAVVSISQVGLRLRLKGGVVRMKDKLLTVPTDPLAHGKRAREFDDLVFVPRNKGFTRGLLFQDSKVLYVLRTQTTHEADPSVLPTEAEMNEAAIETTLDWLEDEFGGPA